jgi:hypothetical protein
MPSLLALSGFLHAQNVPRSSHVCIITEENHSYEAVVGNAQMPYYNQLIHRYGLATQFYSNQHSSLPALMWFVAGAPVELNNNTTSCGHNNDNVVRELLKQGYKWKTYQENMPYAGFQPLYGGTNNSYYRRHNPSCRRVRRVHFSASHLGPAAIRSISPVARSNGFGRVLTF